MKITNNQHPKFAERLFYHSENEGIAKTFRDISTNKWYYEQEIENMFGYAIVTEIKNKCCNNKVKKIEIILTESLKNKLNKVNGAGFIRDFPNSGQPSLEWAGAVLDLLEEMKLDNLIY